MEGRRLFCSLLLSAILILLTLWFTVVMNMTSIEGGIYQLTLAKGGIGQISQTVHTEKRCSFKFRKELLQSKCQEQLSIGPEYTSLNKESNNLGYVLFDHDLQVLGCYITKTGSESWLKFMADSKPRLDPTMKNSDYAKTQKDGLRSNLFLNRLNLETKTFNSVSDMNSKYQNWTKYITIRHPLQRLVSGYFEMKHTYPDIKDIYEFASRLASGELINQDIHWINYVKFCKVCQVDYDLIIKSETIDEDIPHFKEETGVDKKTELQFIHLNRYMYNKTEPAPEKVSHKYKYDVVFQNLKQTYPKVLEYLVNLFRVDMELFGYQWDSDKGCSYCATHVTAEGQYCC